MKIIFVFWIKIASSRKRRKGSTNNQQDPQPKNAVAILNELKKNLVYELESQEGPYHAPVFTMSVLVSYKLKKKFNYNFMFKHNN